MGRFKPKAARGRTKPRSGIADSQFVLARAQWLGYTADPRPMEQRVLLGRATDGARFDEVMREIAGLSRHTEQPDGTWTMVIQPLNGRPTQALLKDEPARTLRRSMTYASELADMVLPRGGVLLYTIDGDPERLAREYQARHSDVAPVADRMWCNVVGAPQSIEVQLV